jgi:branched-chain amino acid aminotransferase
MTRIDERPLQPGPIYKKARALYWEFAHDTARRPPSLLRMSS